MRQRLNLPAKWDGNLWHYSNRGRVHARHHHAELEFNVVTRGAGVYLLSNRKYRIHRGDLLWLFPAQEHVLVDESRDFEMWIGVFRPRTVRRAAVDPGIRVLRQANPPGEFCRRLSDPDLARLDLLFGEVAAMQERSGCFNAGLSYALINAWLRFERSAEVPVRDVHPAVEKAAWLIRAGSGAQSLAELARRSGLSGARLSRLFRRQTGVALVEFRNRQRIENFLRLYGTGQRTTMLDASLDAGFGSYPQFHRVFKRLMGCAPVEYRRRQGKLSA